MKITLNPHIVGIGRHVFHLSEAPCTGRYCDHCHQCAGPGRCRECNREAMKQEAL